MFKKFKRGRIKSRINSIHQCNRQFVRMMDDLEVIIQKRTIIVNDITEEVEALLVEKTLNVGEITKASNIISKLQRIIEE